MKEQVSKEVCPWNTCALSSSMCFISLSRAALTWPVSACSSAPSLISFLDAMPPPDRKINGPFILPISEKYNDLGTVIVGKIESGRIYKNDSLLLMPNRVSSHRSFSRSSVGVLTALDDADPRRGYRSLRRDDGGA